MENERSITCAKSIAAIATVAIVLGGFSAALIVQSPDIVSAQEVESGDTETAVPATIEQVLADLVAEGVITEEQSTQISRSPAGADRRFSRAPRRFRPWNAAWRPRPE